MTCDAKWMGIAPGSIVYFPGQKLTVVKLADCWSRYDGINEHCCVQLGTGHILHVYELFVKNEPYTGQFIWTT